MRGERRRSALHISILALCLVAVNFGFDWWRRYSFESEKGRLKDHIQSLRSNGVAEQDAATILLQRAKIQLTELEGLSHRLTRFVDRANYGGAVPSLTREAPATDPGEASEESELGLSGIFGLSAESILERLDEATADIFLHELYSEILDPKTWNAKEIISRFEERYGVYLDESERQILDNRIESRRQVGHAAFSRFTTEKSLALAERLLIEDYDLADTNGNFPKQELEGDDKVFSVDMFRSKRFLWTRRGNPELFRLNMVYQYVPMDMLLDVQTYLTEGE